MQHISSGSHSVADPLVVIVAIPSMPPTQEFIVGIIKSHGQVMRLLFPISYLMEVVNSANGGNTS